MATEEKSSPENEKTEARAEQQTPATEAQPEKAQPGKAQPEKKGEGRGKEAAGESGGGEEAPKKEVTAQDLLKADIGAVKVRKAKGSKNISSGIAHILATFNNTKVSITDQRGNLISWSSAGKMNFRGSRKSTAYAAQIVTQDAARAAMAHGLKEVVVHVKGPGMGRDSAVRALQAVGLDVTAIVDTTPVPHNGCRPPKRRRV